MGNKPSISYRSEIITHAEEKLGMRGKDVICILEIKCDPIVSGPLINSQVSALFIICFFNPIEKKICVDGK